MSKDTVWVSQAMMDSTLIKPLDADVFLKDQKTTIETLERNDRGEWMPPDRFPKKIYGKYRDGKVKKLPDICMAGGFWTVSANCAEVLRQFELGRTTLHEVKIFQHDQTTPVEGEYFCINFGETKDAFVPEESPRARVFDAFQWKLAGDAKDGDLALKSNAAEGVDLWIDPKVRHAFFLTNPLVQALKDAKLTRRFGLRKCRVLDT
ncbi:imm11 family protein [Pseudaestuariivita rosea]|uniref:imm11 family protein n=1 Tax=Pseudaestuariivita rosea TaxID=2763263 RepID=UPI001ABBBD0A|nr:hypothetical protein [Pseudaestuariivita rosea]